MNILAVNNQSIGSTWWRLLSPAHFINNQSKNNSVKVISLLQINEKLIKKADIIIFQMIVSPSIFLMLKEYKKPIILDLDDWFSGVEIQNHSMIAQDEVKKSFIKSLHYIDAITVTNQYFEKKIRDLYTGLVYVIPNYIDWNWWNLNSIPLSNNLKENTKIKIGWIVDRHHSNELRRYLNPLVNYFNKKYSFLEWHLHEDSREYYKGTSLSLSKINFHKTVPIQLWPSFINNLKLDIGIAYLSDNIFNNCKSPIKYFEYSASNIAGVYSYVNYETVVQNKKTGLLSNCYEELLKNIELLINSNQLRKNITKQSNKDIRKKYLLEKNISKRLSIYESILDNVRIF